MLFGLRLTDEWVGTRVPTEGDFALGRRQSAISSFARGNLLPNEATPGEAPYRAGRAPSEPSMPWMKIAATSSSNTARSWGMRAR